MYNEVMPMHEGRELPQFTLRQSDLPEVMKLEVNNEVYLVMKVKVIGKRSRQDLDTKNEKTKMEADFQVLTLKALGDKPISAKTLEQQHFEQTVAKIKSGQI